MSAPNIALSKEQLIEMATSHPNHTARRSACHTLFSLGQLVGALDMARADAKLQAVAGAAESIAAEAIAKAARLVKP